MTVVSSNGIGLVDKDNVSKDELGPTQFVPVLVVLVCHVPVELNLRYS